MIIVRFFLLSKIENKKKLSSSLKNQTNSQCPNSNNNSQKHFQSFHHSKLPQIMLKCHFSLLANHPLRKELLNFADIFKDHFATFDIIAVSFSKYRPHKRNMRVPSQRLKINMLMLILGKQKDHLIDLSNQRLLKSAFCSF